MREHRKQALAAVLCLCCLLMLTLSRASGETVYFMAVNDVPLDLSADNMPTVSQGMLYVPYTMFSEDATGVNLGVYAIYNSSKGRVLVYSNRQQLFFDIQENTTYDLDGNTYPERAMLRNATVYLPIGRVCSVFGGILNYSVNSTQYGQLVRVKNSAAVLSDNDFIAAASNKMSESLDRYLQSQPSPTPRPYIPLPSPAPSPSREPGIDGEGAGLCVAFILSSSADKDLSATLKSLDSVGCQGLFLFTPEELSGQDALVRQVVGQGHLIGVRTQAESPQAALSELERAGEQLTAAVRCRLVIVWAESLDEDGLTSLEQSGYVCWRTGIDGREPDSETENWPQAILTRLTAGASAQNFLLLDTGAGTVADVLNAAAEANFELRAPTPTELVRRT